MRNFDQALQVSIRRGRRICLLDLDLQTSHLCDHLDIEPRLQIQEILENPDRLDAQLFDLFVSRHAASGIDVLASPRSRGDPVGLGMAVLLLVNLALWVLAYRLMRRGYKLKA